MKHTDSYFIGKLGGPAAVGRICRVSSQAVTAWKRKGIPPARRMFLELLRPDVFGLKQSQGSESSVSATPQKD